MESRRPVLLYDGGCRVCRFAARAVAALDRGGRLALLPLEDPEAEALVAPLPDQERFTSWHLVRPEGAISSRGAAVIDLLGALGHPRISRAAAQAAGPIERLYSLVADHRDKLGRFAPDGPAPRRFP